MTATYAPACGLPGTVTITYPEGTTVSSPVTVPDRASSAVPQKAVVAAHGDRVNGSGRAQSTRAANLYSIAVDVDPHRQPASATLPTGPRYMGAKSSALHVFARATDGPGSAS